MTPLLLDINAPEFVLLLVIAIILFGPERLPDLARKAARLLRYLRAVAGNAQQQLSKELGSEFENVDFRSGEVAEAINSNKDHSPGGPQDVIDGASSRSRTLTPFDLEAT